MNKNVKTVLSTIVAVAVALAAFAPYHAYAVEAGPQELEKTKTYVAYRLFDGDRAAFVVTTKGKTVTVPKAVKYNGKKYAVRGILTLGKDAKRVNLNARIEVCADKRLWKCRVYTPYKCMYKWLKSTGCKRVVLRK
jgi:hypothetical protein